MKFEKQKVTTLKVGLSVFLIGLLIGVLVAYAATPSTTFTISSGIYPGAPSYTIWREESNYFAKDDNGDMPSWSGKTDATTVIQKVFDQNPQSVFFKVGTYDLNGHTVTANVPIQIEGEGKDSIILGGTLKVQGTGFGTWTENNNVVRNLRFYSSGEITNLWFVNVTYGVINQNSFWKTSFALDIPQIRLTDSLTIRVRDNWFDGYNCQILRIDGTWVTLPLHIITNNDFGSTLAGTFPTPSNPWQVAAIYIKGTNSEGINIADNLGYVHPNGTFVYCEAPLMTVKNNHISCANAYGYYAIDSQSDHIIIEGNRITVGNAGGGAIAIRKTTDLEETKGFNFIKNNDIIAHITANPIYGVLVYSVIEGNTIYAEYGITLHNSAHNLISNNIFSWHSPQDRAFRETGSTAYNVLVGNNAFGSYIYTLGTFTKVNLCWNNTDWIP